ncbi:Cof-type HAD-IIB family hydrolase [Microbacterium sp.]|uniref:Cof-type HAD-IIB family hydrolase n=1 Tax=Microbacterium sp. TaxID=51671 RepID=UPI003221A3F6
MTASDTAPRPNRPDARVPTRRPCLVAIDVDGTLIGSDHRLAGETVAAVRDAVAAGIAVVLASSRPPAALRAFLLELGLTEPASFVSCQGALVGSYDPAGRLRVHASRPIRHDVAREAAALAHRAGASVNWYTGERWLVERVTTGVAWEASIVGIEPDVVDGFEGADAPEKLLLIVDDPADAAPIADRLRASVSVESSHPRYLEVTARGIDKATGVRVIADADGIEPAAVVAIGDGHNDLGLFAYAGLSIAPANARPAVLAHADFVTASADDHGVAAALRWLAALPEL